MNSLRLSVERKKLILLLLYLIVVTLLLSLLFFNHFYDDPFITYRYAYNLSHGRGFVYNPGLRVQSTTTPLFTLLLAGGSFFSADIPHVAVILSAFSLALGAVFLWYLAASWGTAWVGWAGLLLYPIFPLLVSTISSETPLYLALCIGSFTCYARRAYISTAVLTALAVLTRPDGLLVPLILSVDFIFQQLKSPGCDASCPERSEGSSALHLSLTRLRSHIPWKAILLFFLIVTPWFFFAWLYFGTPIPATLFTKQQQGTMAISQRFAPGFLTIIKPYTQRWFYWLEAALAAVGLVFAFWRSRNWLVFLSWTALYFVSFALLGVSRYYWYYAPLVPGFVVMVGLGLTAIHQLLKRQHGLATKIHPIHFPVSALPNIILLSLLFLGSLDGIKTLMRWSDTRYPLYRAVGEWLHRNTPAKASVGTLEVGIIGYYADRPIVEFAGLILPEVARQLKTDSTYEDAALWAVEQYHPDFLVLHDGHFQRFEQDYVHHNCMQVQTFSGETYGYPANIVVYDCRSPSS